VELEDSGSVPKLIDRIGLGGELGKIFFGRLEGNRVPFKGTCVTLKRHAIHNLDDLLKQLLQKHNDADAPQFK
jgi:hypothetical protein